MNKNIEVNGNMNLGAYSPLELAEEEYLNEVSNKLLANYMEKAKSMDRERQYDVAKKHAIDTINQKYRDFMVRDLTWPDRAYYKFSVDFKDGYGFIIEVYYVDTVDSRNNYVLYLTPERPLYQIDGSYIGQDTPVGYMIKNMRAGERMKFKELCKEANDLNGNSEETLNEVDRHRPEYYADYAKRTGKKDRHKKGYYKKYNKEHPERLNRGYTKGYKGGCIDNGPIGGTQDNEIIGYDMLGRPITKDPFLDKLRNKTEFEWHDEDWDEGGYKDVHESVTKQNSLRSMIREGLAELAGEQFTHQLGPDGDVVYGKDEQGFFVYTKHNLGVKYFNTPEEAEEYARKIYRAIRLRKNAERREFDRQLSLDEDVTNNNDTYTMEDWKRDGTLKIRVGQLIAPEVYYQLRNSVPPMSDGNTFQVGEAYSHDFETGQALYQTFRREGDDLYRYIGLCPARKNTPIQESKLKKMVKESVQKHLVDVMKRYSQGNATAEEANKAIMDLANSSVKDKKINESYAKDGNYTHFAVHKNANKIVNGWDYSDYDNAELRQFAKDYFYQDLIDYELDPKQYTILTVQGCKKRGIDPYDDSNWANGYDLNETKGEGTNPYYGEKHDMENKKIENQGNMTWKNFKK